MVETPGSGKTYVVGKYDDVWDADDLIVEAINELSYFDCSRQTWGNVGSRHILGAYFRFIHFNRRLMNWVYERALEKMQEKCERDDVVLLGTKDLMHRADRVFIQENNSTVRDGFNSDAEQYTLANLAHGVDVHYIDEYLDNSLQRVCGGRR